MRRLSVLVFLAVICFTKLSAAIAATEEFDPYRPDAAQILKDFDRQYESATGLPSHLPDVISGDGFQFRTCVREGCQVFAHVVKSEQTLYLYVGGTLSQRWLVSTGLPGHGTPDFDRHPDGRIYDYYDSERWPGGDYMGLGNMPYAVFIQGGFAIHGTPEENWSKLGRPASHGCIRLHPSHARVFNRMVRSAGIANVWITVD